MVEVLGGRADGDDDDDGNDVIPIVMMELDCAFGSVDSL